MKQKFILLLISFILISFYSHAQISGIVYKDYDASGTRENGTVNAIGATVIEPLVQGVTVKAFSSSDVLLATTTTNASGAYSFTGLTLPVRIEFSGLPASFLPGCATDQTAIAGSNVQFISSPTTTADFRINNPDDYSQLRPMVLITQNYIGRASANTTDGTLNGVYYNTKQIITPLDARIREFYDVATPNVTGTTWGLAYSRKNKVLFNSAVVRNYFGNKIDATNSDGGFDDIFTFAFADPNDTIGVYGGAPGWATLTPGSTIDLSVLGLNMGTDPRPAEFSATTPITENSTLYQKVGKIGIGGIDVSTDGDTLYVINLRDGGASLGIINVKTTNAPVLISEVPMPNPGCTNGVFRPWAVKYYQGFAYIGGVCDASGGSGTAANLQAYVYRYDGGSSFTQIVTMPLNYARGKTTFRDVPSSISANWTPWRDTWAPQTLVLGDPDGDFIASQPQPILMDLEFTEDGSLLLGFGDRFTYQAAFNQRAYDDFTNSNITYSITGGGDVIKFCNIAGTLTLEATPGACAQSNFDNGSASFGGSSVPTAPQIAGAIKEFFDDDFYNTGTSSVGQAGHSETSLGALAILPGRNQLVASAFDPITTTAPGGTSGAVNSSGIRKFNSTNGNYETNAAWEDFLQTNTGSNRKGGNSGDIEILSDAAPIEIGNRLWNDLNANGIQDAGEPVFPNVSVDLYLDANNDCIPDGAALASVITNANGEYVFSNQVTSEYPASNSGAKFNITALVSKQNYIVRIGAADWNSTTGEGIADLANFHLTTSNAIGNGTSDWSDNDATLANIAGSKFAQICFTTGILGSNDHSQDFGFKNTISLCGVVWNDINANATTVGAPDGTEQVINGTNIGGGITTGSVLYANLLDASNNVLATTPIATDGSYCFPLVPQKATGIKVQLTTNQGTVGQPKPATNLPTGWATTGENKNTQGGAADVLPNSEIPVTTDIINITVQNFGIQQLPESAVHTEVLGLNPGGAICSPITASWFETSNVGVNPNTQDYNGGTVTNIRITSFPTNATSITVNGTTYLSTDPIWSLATPGILIPYTSGTGPTQAICLDPIDGLVTSVIPFVSIDNAGMPDPTPGSVAVSYSAILPVRFLSISALKTNKSNVITWQVGTEINISHYEIEKSIDGINFSKIGTIVANNNSIYQFDDKVSIDGTIFYRVKVFDNSASYDYSTVVKLVSNVKGNIQLVPNPVVDFVTINGLSGTGKISIFTMEGKQIDNFTVKGNVVTYNLQKLKSGTYILQYIDDKTVRNLKFVKK